MTLRYHPGMTFFLRAGALALAVFATACTTLPRSAEPATVLLVSVDGLRPADVTAADMPVLQALGEAGVRAEGMRPSFPALTFPNHYTLVTGLRPDRHGIVHNTMADAELGGFRTANREAVGTGAWWGGVPVWVSVQRNGSNAATMFWPGSEAEILGMRPWQWRPYQDNSKAVDNVRQVLHWLDTPPAERPRFVTMYLDQVDEASHEHGPNSSQAVAARRDVDAAIAMLLDGLRARGRLATTNLVIVSDHGFDTVPAGHVISTAAMAPEDVARAISDGQVITFEPKPGKAAEAERLLLGEHPHYSCWRKDAVPAQWQYGTHPRVPTIVCQMAPGWDALWPRKHAWILQNRPHDQRGSHGYDPDLPQMRATFIASGPAFRNGVTLPVFDNVDIYPLLMRLLRLPAEPNDGDIAPLLPALRDGR